MTLVEWLSLALVCFLGAATPGPSLAIIVNHTLKSGASTGRLASVSHAVAVGLYALMAVLGLAAVFKLYPLIGKAFVYAGALYLAYLGFKILTTRSANDNQPSSSASIESNPVNFEGVKQAFLIAFLNPKLAVFFLALFSQFIPAQGAGLELTLILVGTVLIIDMLWYLVVVESLIRLKSRVSLSKEKASIIAKTQGIIFILIAVNAALFSS